MGAQDRKPEWRQPTPRMQIQAYLSGLQGYLMTIKDGGKAHIHVDAMIELTKEAMAVAKLDDLNEWKSGYCGLHERAEPCPRCAVYSTGGPNGPR